MRRFQELSESDLQMLVTVSALNAIGMKAGVKLHRRDALWQVQKYGSRAPRTLEEITEHDETSPFAPMTPKNGSSSRNEERRRLLPSAIPDEMGTSRYVSGLQLGSDVNGMI